MSAREHHQRRWHEVACYKCIKKTSRRPSRQKEILTRQQGWCPQLITSSSNWRTPRSFKVMSCELDDSKEEEDRKSIMHSNVRRRCQDGQRNWSFTTSQRLHVAPMSGSIKHGLKSRTKRSPVVTLAKEYPATTQQSHRRNSYRSRYKSKPTVTSEGNRSFHLEIQTTG
jgi:hypothetical protein